MHVNIKKARNSLSEILNRVEKGEEIVLTRRGKTVATLAPPPKKLHLPVLKNFRDSIQIKSPRLSETVTQTRDEERY